MDARFQLPPDGFIQITPLGEFLHKGTGIMQVIDARAVREMANRFQAEARAQNSPGILIDYDHFSYDTSKASRAAGWITALENRSDGLYGKVRWSTQGEADVSNGTYLFISPVFLPSDTETLGDKRVRPLRLDRAGLTNDPNIPNMKPLANRRGGNRTVEGNSDATTPQQAANAISAKAREYQNRAGLSYQVAFEMACNEMPEMVALGNRASGSSSQKEKSKGQMMANRQGAADLFGAKVQLVQNRYKIDFQTAWDVTSKENAELLLLANREASDEQTIKQSGRELGNLRIEAWLERIRQLQAESGSWLKAWRQILATEAVLFPLLNRSALEQFRQVAGDGPYSDIEKNRLVESFVKGLEELRARRDLDYVDAWTEIAQSKEPNYSAILSVYSPEVKVAMESNARENEERDRQRYIDAGLTPPPATFGYGKGQR